jgi:tetratricopeptide (TPR) repeat protein
MAIELSDNVSKIYSLLTSQQDLKDSTANTMLSSGITLMTKNKYTEAAKAFKQAAAYKPDLTEAYTYLGDAYVKLGKNKEAVDAYKLSLKVDRTQDTLYTNLANLYIDMKQPADAEKILKAGINQNKQNTLAYYTLGQIQAQQGRYEEAEANFSKVVKLEPKDGNSYYALGMSLNGQKKYDDAIQQLEKAVKLKRNFVPAMFELGSAYIGNGDNTKAQEQIDLLNKLDTSESNAYASDLQNMIRQPKMLYFNSAKSTLNLGLGPTPLLGIAPTEFITPNTSKDFTVKFVFDSEMDAASVMKTTNWQITKARGGTGGLYNNGLYSPKEVSVPVIPKSVSYDPVTQEATLVLSIRQNSTISGIIDPSHMVFKFMGKDVNGKTMDPSADQYDSFAGNPF